MSAAATRPSARVMTGGEAVAEAMRQSSGSLSTLVRAIATLLRPMRVM